MMQSTLDLQTDNDMDEDGRGEAKVPGNVSTRAANRSTRLNCQGAKATRVDQTSAAGTGLGLAFFRCFCRTVYFRLVPSNAWLAIHNGMGLLGQARPPLRQLDFFAFQCLPFGGVIVLGCLGVNPLLLQGCQLHPVDPTGHGGGGSEGRVAV